MVTINTDITTSFPSLPPFSPASSSEFCLRCDAFHTPCNEALPVLPSQAFLSFDDNADPHCYEELFKTFSNDLVVPLTSLLECAQTLQFEFSSCIQPQAFDTLGFGDLVSGFCNQVREYVVKIAANFVTDVGVLVGSQAKKSFYEALGDLSSSFCSVFIDFVTGAKKLVASVAVFVNNFVTLMSLFVVQPLFEYGAKIAYLLLDIVFGVAEKASGTSLSSLVAQAYTPSQNPLVDLCSLIAPKCLENFGKQAAALNSIIMLGERCHKHVALALNWIYNQYLAHKTGIDPDKIPILSFSPEAVRYMDAFDDALSDANVRACKTDPVARAKVSNLRQLGDFIIAKFPSSVPREARDAFHKMHSRVVVQQQLNNTYCDGVSQTRVEPIGVALVGPPGIGKDTVLRMMLEDIAKNFGVENKLLTKNASSAYYSNFSNQPFLLYSEFQSVKPVARVDGVCEAAEILNVINITPHLLVVESEPLKAVSYANFAAVFLTSNSENFDLSQLTEPEAFHRRFQLRLIPVCLKGFGFRTAPGSAWSNFPLVFSKLAGIPSTVLTRADFKFIVLDPKNKILGFVDYDNVMTMISQARDKKLADFRNSLVPQGKDDESELKKALDELDLIQVESNDLSNPKSYVVACCLAALACNVRSVRLVVSQQAYFAYIKKLNVVHPIMFALFNSKHKDRKLLSEVFLQYTDSPQAVDIGIFADLTDQIHEPDLWFNLLLESEIHTFVRLKHTRFNVSRCSSLFYSIVCKDPVLAYKFSDEGKFFMKYFQKFDNAYTLVKHRIMLDPCMQFLIGYFGGCVLFYAGAKIFSYLFGKKEKNDSPQVLDPEMGTSSDDYMKDTHLGRHTPGSARSLKNANYRLRNHKRGILQAQAAHDERAVTAARVIMTRNTVRVCFYSAENIVISSVYGIYLKAKFLLLPRHILPMFKICPTLVISTGYNKNVIRLDTKSVLLSSSIDDRYDMLVTYHPQMMRYPDITNHLITWEELSQVSSTNIIFCKPKIAGKENEGDTQVLAHARYYETSTEPYEFRGAKNRTTGYLAYDVHTIPGDCGAPIFASNNLIEHKLLAFHTVANRTTKVGMGQVLFREVVLDHINSIATDDVVPQSDELFQKYPLGPLPEDEFFEIPNHAVLGVVDKKLSSTSNIRTTKLQASPFQKDLLHGSYQPAGMAANYVEGDLVIHNLQKKARHHKTGHKAEFDRAWDALYENLVRTSFPPRSPETTLTFVQAVDGIDGEPFSDALPKKTATGWPDSHEYKHATKKPIFESESLTKQVFDDVQNVLEECKTKVPSTVFTLFGKDELRTIEKIQKGSIRLVFGCPTKITIAFRMLFGPFMRWVMSNHVVNGVAVGLNVHGPGWDLLARTLLAKGNKMIDFDVESFDFNECVEVLFGFPDIVNRWCGDDEETQEQRRNLWSSMMNALVIYLCYIFMRSGNICSGCPATAVVNSLIVIVFMLVAWRRTMKTCKLAYYEDEGNFFKYCAIIAFGDDNIVSVAPEVSSYFTPTAICSALAEIGVPVTDAATKTSFTGDIAFKPLSECVFLQRRFVIDPETQRYVAPLRLESILKMISWYRQSVDFTVAINDNLQTGSMELSLHGFDVYEHYRKIIERVIANKKLPYTMMKFERALSSQLLRSYEIPDQELVAQAGGPEKGPKVRDSVHRLVLEAEPFREPPVSALDTLSLISLENNGELKNYYCLQNETSLIHFYEWLYKQPDNLLLPRFQRYFLKIDLAEYEAYWSTLNRIQHWYLVYYITNATRGGLQKFQPFEIHLLGDPSDENLMLQYRQMHARFAFCTGADNLVAQASYGEQHQILEFTDDSTSFHLEKPGMVVCDLQKQDISEMRQHDIIDFLGRPFELPTVTLATGGSSLDILGTWTFPDVLFTSPMYLEKLKNFRNFRANINFKVMVNAAPTDTGMLRLFFSPFQSQVGTRTANSTLACKTGYPGQDIDIGPGVALTHVMPYCAPMSGYDLPNQTGTIGEFELIYVSPYRSNGTGTPTVTLLVWCSDVQLTVPTNTDLVFPPVSFSMKSLEKETALLALDYLKRYEAKKGDVLEAQAEDHTRKKNETGTISDITGKFGTAFNSLEKVPLIGSASKAVGGVLNTTSKIAKSVGYCKEPNLSCVQPFANVPGRGFTNMVGMDDSVKLAGHPDNHLEKVDGLSATTRDEMDIATFASKEAICHSFTFGTTTPVGTILAAIPVCPGYCQTGTTTTVDSTPLGFVGGPFLFWRGSIYYRVKVVKNSFYSFRLRISFVPGLRFDQITAATNFDTCYTKFVDMRGVDSVNVKIPYNPPYPWLRNFYGTLSSTLVGFAGPNASLGTLVISLASRVLVPTTCPDTMDGFIYIRGGEDIRFAFANFTNVRVNQPFVPLAESTESVVPTVLEKVDYEPGDVLQAQAEDGPTNAFAGASPSDTQTTGPISTSGMLTSTSVNSTSMEQACIGEEFTNVRQLIKRFAQPAASFTTNDTTQTLNVDPAYFGTGANVEHIPLWYYSWGYRFYRGSTRYKWMWTPTTITTEVLPRRIVSYMDQVTFTTGPFAPTLAAGFTLYAATAQHVTYPQAFNPVHEVELPFFRQTAMSVISSTLTGEDNNRPVMTIRNDGIPTGSISTWQLKVAAGDDFEFLYQIGTPRLNIAP